MNFAEKIERIEKAHDLIRLERTGCPSAFASKLQMSVSQLYDQLEFFEELHIEVRYSIKKESFYYVRGLNVEFVTL